MYQFVILCDSCILALISVHLSKQFLLPDITSLFGQGKIFTSLLSFGYSMGHLVAFVDSHSLLLASPAGKGKGCHWLVSAVGSAGWLNSTFRVGGDTLNRHLGWVGMLPALHGFRGGIPRWALQLPMVGWHLRLFPGRIVSLVGFCDFAGSHVVLSN